MPLANAQEISALPPDPTPKGMGEPSSPTLSKPRGILLEPVYGYRTMKDPRPSLREIYAELIDCICVWRDRRRLLPALAFAFHTATFVAFFVYVFFFWTTRLSWSIAAVSVTLGVLNNTVWFHRYCTHRAFRFRSLLWARLFLWTSPPFFREESYALAHHVHHGKSDVPGDPHGPHLGWIGNYFSFESQQKINTAISREEFQRQADKLKHIGFAMNTYEEFQRTAEFETLGHYATRMLFVNLLWGTLSYLYAGWPGVLAWYAALFAYDFIVRDFNYQGHGGFFARWLGSKPFNHPFYGFVAGEWHRNHHDHPASMRTGLRWWQLDLPYWFVRALHAVGIVNRYTTVEE